jgi:glycosyltransferase involved in cell wall biosynthesis
MSWEGDPVVDPPTTAPIISVAIATRNYGQYLPRALSSALRAAACLGVPFEIVVVDDASTDDTREILERFRLGAPDRIKVIYRSTSRGVSVAKNTALGHCSGHYVALLDADDEFHPEKLARCYARIAGEGANLVTHDFVHRRSPAEQYWVNATNWAAGTDYDFWPPSTWVFRNGLLRFNEQMIGGSEDLEWLARRRRVLRRAHVGMALNIQHHHADSLGQTNDSLTPAYQVMARMKGELHADDRRAPRIWACRDCGRQLLLPAICCGRPAVPTPLLFYSVVESPPSPTSPEFSFVFLTKNQVALTRRAVDSLLACLGETRAELVFVDGGSSDETLSAIRGWAASVPVKLVWVPPEEPFNYSRNCNRGARAASGAYLLLVNNDIEVCSAGLMDALRAALVDLRVGVVGVSTVWNDAQCDPSWNVRQTPYVFTHRPLAGHFWGTRREVYWELGGMDRGFTGYGYEELDFHYRALRAHYRLALAAGQVAHHGSATFTAVHGAAAMRQMEQVNRAAFEKKHGYSIYAEGNRIEPFATYKPPIRSVVMVARNVGRELRRTLETAMGDPACQDGSTQLIVVNNASTDDTVLVLAEYRRRLPRLLSVIELGRPVQTHQALAIGHARAIGQAVLTVEPGEWVGSTPRPSRAPSADPGKDLRLGRWEVLPEDTQILAVHAALLHTGKVLYFAGSEHNADQQVRGDLDHSRLWDPVTGAIQRVGSPTHDLFCSGHAFLADGRLLAAGGTQEYDISGTLEHSHSDLEDPHPDAVQSPGANHRPAGLRDTSLFDPRSAAGTNPWVSAAPMNTERGRTLGGGRWYPTVLTLADGRAVAMSGVPDKTDSRRDNTMVELFDPSAGPQGRWSDAGEQPAPTFVYPRMHLLPDGQALSVTAMHGQTQKWNPTTRAWTSVAPSPGAGYDPDPAHPGDNEISWTSVLLPLLPPDYRTRVLVAGKAVARTIDLGERGRASRAVWVNAGARSLPEAPGRHPANAVRPSCNAVLLPDATVLVLGGTPDGKDAHAVLAAELYDPATDRWTTLGSASVPRVYHSVGLLLPDGRVWTAGSNHDGERGLINRELRMEVFHSPYLFRGPRPTIEAAPDEIELPSTFALSSPQAPAIRSVALIRCGSVTHAFNADQRYVGLAIESRTATQLGIASPPDSRIAPPGYYLLFIVDDSGVPSIGKFVRIT